MPDVSPLDKFKRAAVGTTVRYAAKSGDSRHEATMKPIVSNAEFFAALKSLIYSWCDRRALNPLARVLGPYVAFAGLTDSWGELLDALKTIDASCRRDISESEMDTLRELIKAAQRAVYRDQNSR